LNEVDGVAMSFERTNCGVFYEEQASSDQTVELKLLIVSSRQLIGATVDASPNIRTKKGKINFYEYF
jgi:hypothetical protein